MANGYQGVRAGAIASGFFVVMSTFLVLYLVAVYFIISPEGRPDDTDRVGVVFYACLSANALLSLWLGLLTKLYFDHRAGRR
jgi:hypothetical protein